MHALHRKLLRDCAHMATQLGAIALVVAAAVSTYVTMRGAYEALVSARSSTYATLRFGHVFVHARRAPLQLQREILAIPGVAAADCRVVADVPLDVPGLTEAAIGRIVSYDGTLHLLHLRRGRLFDPAAPNEAVVSELFARANHVEIGSTLGAVLNGKWERVHIVGIGTSPEYLNELSGVAVFPDHQRFGVLWMPPAAVAGAFAMRGSFNDVAVVLARGADEQNVIAALDRLLEPYGGSGAYGRVDQLSDRFTRSEIAQDRITATTIPAIFLFVAAFLVHTVLARLVAGQREQIAILKAFGYSSAALAAHYVGFAMLVVTAGSVVGVPIGIWLGRGLTSLYREFYNFPQLEFVVSPAAIAISVGASALSAAAAASMAAFHAARIPPAEGMRGERPPSFHTTALEPMHALLSSPVRMIARSIERRPARAGLSVLGIAFAVMILISGRYSFDALDEMVAVQFRSAQRDDVTVAFVDPRPPRVMHDLQHLPGVRRVETFRAVPVRLRSGHFTRRTVITALDRAAQLRRLVADDGSITPIPPHGVVLTGRLAQVLHAGRGDVVRVETLEGRRVTFDVPIAATVDELVGIGAWIDRGELARLMREEQSVSGAFLSIDRQRRDALNHELKRLPVVASALYREAMLNSFLETAAKSLSTSMTAIIIFACIIAFAVVYNSARIALSERGRELATLRVLGFSVREVALLLLGEQAIVTIIGVPIGFLFGQLVARWLAYLFETDDYRLPLTISGDTYAFAFLIVLGAGVVSAAAVWRRIARLDLVEVLKARE